MDLGVVKLRNEIVSYFQINGYCLRNDSIVCLCQHFESVPICEREEWLKEICESLEKQPLTSSVLNETIIAQAIKDCSESGTQNEEYFNVVNAFDVPHFTYNAERKRFIKSGNSENVVGEVLPGPASLSPRSPGFHHGKADSKYRLFLERFQIIHQRMMRHHLFAFTILKSQHFTLKPVEYLLGASEHFQSKVIVLGMLTQLRQGVYHLEDPTGMVQLDLTQTTYKNGLFTENSFVLVEGTFQEGILKANAIGYPPAETSLVSIQNLGNLNFFGGSSSTSLRTSQKLRILEEKNGDAMFVFISDVWLADNKVLEKLKLLFSGYVSSPPTAFVFLGNFVSSHKVKLSSKILKDSLKLLGNIIREFPQLLINTKFIFVPGPDDPGLSTILPRPPIPVCVTRDFSAQVPNSIFSSNPCRIQFCTQEIIVFREDLQSKICRNSINSPWQEQENIHIPTLVAKSLIGNSHLCPLPLNVSPVYWDFDHSLRLYPLPDLVVIGDKCDPYKVENSGTTFINPGSFPRSDFSFKVYFPVSKEIEDSQIN